jgi:16S rRNA (cytosine1402-N4)-methyltransferase
MSSSRFAEVRSVETNTTKIGSIHAHQPVLLEAVLRCLAPKPGQTLLDLTAGYGGHAAAVLEKIGPKGRATLVDRDGFAVAALRQRFAGDDRVSVEHDKFSAAAAKLLSTGRTYDMILLDLGVSSPQFDMAERGFSIMREGELDMRMDRSQAKSAEGVVNRSSRSELIDILRRWGEEPAAAKIADAIIAARPLRSTRELAEAVERTIHRRQIHPATRTFQAIRIAVNDELDELGAVLPLLLQLLAHGGRLAIISFHSLEDRMVKQFFREQAQGYLAQLQLITKRPIDGSTHDTQNPRARSAKLRAAVKINTMERG